MDCGHFIGDYLCGNPESQIIMAQRLQGKILWLSILVRAVVFVIVAFVGITYISPKDNLGLITLFLLSLLMSRAGGYFFVKFYDKKKKDS